MPVEQKASLVSQWHDRLLEAEAEQQAILSEQKEVQGLIDEVVRNLKRHEGTAKKEQAALEGKLQELENEANSLSSRHEAIVKQKDSAEKEYRSTLDAYEKLHAVVKAIKDDEHDLTHRPDLELALERESAQWSQEEHRLREELFNYDATLRKQRKMAEKERHDLQLQLDELEEKFSQEQEERAQVRAGWGQYPKLPTSTTDSSSRASVGRKRPMQDLTNSL